MRILTSFCQQIVTTMKHVDEEDTELHQKFIKEKMKEHKMKMAGQL